MAVPILLAWSGGKDSALTLAALNADPAWDVVGLLTMTGADDGRISIHGIPRAVLLAQAAAAGLPVIAAPLPANPANGTYEGAMAAALAEAQGRWPGLRHIAFGDLFLADVRAYRERTLAPLGWQPVFPLWGRDTAELAHAFIAQGFRAVLTCVDTTQIPADFAGRAYDDALLADLPASADPCGEKGEFHTCTHAGPVFAAPLGLTVGARHRRDGRFEMAEVALAVAAG
ncbi:MAG: ATP-binding protein [Rhodobacteraceae bacterium]|nr:ATP-binding protein [Paracoccaceae bacterium]